MVGTSHGRVATRAAMFAKGSSVVALALVTVLSLGVVPAHAAPGTPNFGPGIEGYAGYDGQDTCDPVAKPGVSGFRDLLNRAYGSHTAYITRACDVGGTSEHKEGRALDYMLDVNDGADRAVADDVLSWLLATDQYGNRHAMARRLGVMYIIWNRRIWKAYEASSGWQSYSGSNPHTDHIHVSFGWAGARKQTTWWSAPSGPANVYGVLPDGRLTFTSVDGATGRRTHGAVVSGAKLGFTPVAMATLNFNTILFTSDTSELYRVDVITNNDSLVFNPPVRLDDGGWSHDLLAYDGNGHLYGIADGVLRRYTIGTAKPALGDITGWTTIGKGFTLKTLTAAGPRPDWILGTTADGRLLSYQIMGAGSWNPYQLRPATWQTYDHLLSPGGGVYLGHRPDGSMAHYIDTNAYNGNGSDISAARAVDSGGWGQVLLSAQPGTVG
ncbi:hypothetical protein GCM10023085_18190 [Actinomadura viridis]|uniref:ARB-07466-like C-terminal domain-containing protein n=1 Tax=Actinomadura viridis TaxID=58110 RepID=A0A931DIM8_9ACTN|nr:hypothetical protein [Actinomadura viridis]MBG6089424.1 hypothetical protein [Actinomadura viridis]